MAFNISEQSLAHFERFLALPEILSQFCSP